MASSRMIERLDAGCRAVAPSIIGVAILGPTQAIDPSWFTVQAPWGVVRVDGPLTTAQQTAVTNVINAFVTTPTLAEQLDQFGGRLDAAVTLKLSTQWSSLTAAQQTRVQNVIDQGAASIIAAVTP